MKNNIILIGMMGAGKTTIGKALSETLDGFSFVDIDESIEHRYGMKISEIFEKYTETGFRKRETTVIKEVCKTNNQIISTGGGAFESEENRNVLLSSGKVFYLKSPSKILYDRIKTQGNRPLLVCDNPEKVFEELLEKREKNYSLADYTIDTAGLTVENCVKEILRRGYETFNSRRDTE